MTATPPRQGMIFDSSPFLPCNTPAPSQGAQSCCLDLMAICPSRAGLGVQAWGGGAFDHYLQVSLGDGLLLHSELQVLHLPAGGEGAE